MLTSGKSIKEQINELKKQITNNQLRKYNN